MEVVGRRPMETSPLVDSAGPGPPGVPVHLLYGTEGNVHLIV